MEPGRRESGPPLPPGPGGILPLLLSVGLVAFLLVGFLTMGTIVEAVRPGGFDDPMNLLLVGLVVFPLAIYFGLRVDPAGFDTLRTGLAAAPVRTSTASFGLAFGLAAVLPVAEVENLVNHVVPRSVEEQTAMLKLIAFDGWLSQLAKVLAIAVITPIGEELIFRGIVLRWLRRSYGRLIAIVVSALLFSAAHLSLTSLAGFFALGLAFGWIADRAHSALPTIGAHAAFNAVPFLFPPDAADVPGLLPAGTEEVAHLPALWVAGSAAACFVLLYLIWWSTLRRE
ncbi:MAG: CPBP family intramembrane metalloprotease [Deltaproteobacteria bacterium]|nr:CPBP family intramembrane metalloprotease [Deltaproteobacteria bacterium]